MRHRVGWPPGTMRMRQFLYLSNFPYYFPASPLNIMPLRLWPSPALACNSPACCVLPYGNWVISCVVPLEAQATYMWARPCLDSWLKFFWHRALYDSGISSRHYFLFLYLLTSYPRNFIAVFLGTEIQAQASVFPSSGVCSILLVLFLGKTKQNKTLWQQKMFMRE
jgi:hypothetical protein